MFKIFGAQFIVGLIAFSATAQPLTGTQDFGKVDKADLELKACDFEKEANAMVLFNKSELYYDQSFNIIVENHKRIKIFNHNGEDQAKIRIEYFGGNRYEYVTGLQAETINPGTDKPEITKLDKKQIFVEHVDKSRDAMVFTFPNVKAGSIIEFKYKLIRNSYRSIPTWYFQEDIPVRYNELSTSIPDFLIFDTKTNVNMPYSKNVQTTSASTVGSGQDAFTYTVNTNKRALSNVRSMPDEPYMSSKNDNLQSVHFSLSAIRPIGTFQQSYPDTWAKVGGAVADDEDFGSQVRKRLSNEDAIISKAKALKTDEEKIAYLFNEVKNDMKWNGDDEWYTNDGTKTAWEKKTGNSAEINIILCHLLKQAGVKAYPMIVSTRKHGKVNPAYPFIYQFNRAVVYAPLDSARQYVLDATDKYNMYNETPANLLNSYGLAINKEDNSYDLIFVKKEVPVRQSIFIDAQITSTGKMDGKVQISSSSYNRISAIQSYKVDGEKKYIDALRDHNNNLKVSLLKMDNMDVDSLPLKQSIDFNSDLAGSDENYIYFNPNLFTSLNTNPFLSDNRYSDIDFGYKKNVNISGIFKLPAGYKIDALPKNINLTMPDNSITFRRLLVNQDGGLVIRYVIQYNKTIYFKEDYPEIHEFYKKMQEMLNEQIVLKKG